LLHEKNARYNDDGKYFLALLKFQQGKASTAEIMLEECVNRAGQRGDVAYQIRSLLALSHLNQVLNKPNQALKWSEDANTLLKEDGRAFNKALTLILKGKALLALDFVDKARICGKELQSVMESLKYWRGGKAGWPKHLQGLIAVKEMNYDIAIELFVNSTPNWTILPLRIPSAYLMLMEPLARAYFDKGDYERALEEYEKINSSYLLRIGYGDIFSRSFYMLGKINAELGRNEEAQANYQKFIDLWKDGDPVLKPIVEDARIRLSRLQDQ
jgi:tetratricopeptide (TPR) repeat protein